MNIKKIKSGLFFVLLVFIVFGGLYNLLHNVNAELTSDDYRTYECDYKSTSLSQTKIETTVGGEPVVIKGGAIAKMWITDPLVMCNSEGNVIANAGDAYGIVSQDDHAIYVDDEFAINMEGKFSLVGNSYKLVDADGTTVGALKCNWTDTAGYVSDVDGNVVATYKSMLGMNDYTVKICDNNICSDEALLLIFASYVSDAKYDNNKFQTGGRT